MDIIVSTRNPSKLEQMQAFFPAPFKLVSLSEARIEGKAPESGKTLRENAIQKARFAFERAGYDAWTMSDDTGLFIDALGGEPGIHAARWLREDAPASETRDYCLKRLAGIPLSKRTATFRAVIAIINPDAEDWTFEAEVKGHVLEEEQAPFQPNMPYSGLFRPLGNTRVWSEMSPEEENKISHRGLALAKALRFLRDHIHD